MSRKARHRRTYRKTPQKDLWRYYSNQWYGFTKPRLKRSLKALQSQIRAFVTKRGK